MNRALSLLLIFGLAFSSQSFAQKNKTTEHKVKSAIGVAVGGQSMTTAQIKEMAINKAKVDALQQAGIEENINSYSDYFRSETNDKMEELFTSDVLSNIRGNVKDIQVIGEPEIKVTPEGQIQIKTEISCTVIKYTTSKDLEFDAWVTGVKNNKFYNEGNTLTFQIKPSLPAYVKVFMFTGESYILLPNAYEPPVLLQANIAKKYPSAKIDYILDAGGHDREMNRMVIVLTKLNIPYTGTADYKEITDWIMTIPPDERVIKSFAFEVVRP
jgi:hypothetical protein